MGRYAQQRKRGGHLGNDAGLPAGPSMDFFHMGVIAGAMLCICDTDEGGEYEYFKSRFRAPGVYPEWDSAIDDPALILVSNLQTSAFSAEVGQQQDGECCFCDVAGNRLTQWSGYHSFIL